MELWAANIGEGIDVLLGMSFMYSAGVRLCAREGLVQLPDEETLLISGRSGNHAHQGLDLPVCPANSVCLQPGGQTVIRIAYGQSNPQREVVWAGRGDHWVTQIIYAAKSWPVAVKVVNVSDKTVWIDPWTPVARIVEFGCFPSAGRFVRPGLTRYQEWQTLIYEHTNSNQARLRQERKDQMLRDAAPPCVPKKDYPWPTKLLTKSSSGDGTAHVIQLRPLNPDLPVPLRETNPEAVIPEGSSPEGVGQDMNERDDSSLDGSRSGSSDSATNEDVRPDADCQMPCLDEGTGRAEVTSSGDIDSDGDELFDSISLDDDCVYDSAVEEREDPDLNAYEDDLSDLPTQALPCTPVRQLEEEYERCMRLNAEEFDLEPAVYIHEGSDLLSQLRDQLAMLPELSEPSPKCDIETADVGDPELSTPDEIQKLRSILKYHRLSSWVMSMRLQLQLQLEG
jgi:hypothetical protein